VKVGTAFFRFIRGYDIAISDPYSQYYIDARQKAESAPKANTFTLSADAARKLTRQVQGTKAIAEEAAVLAEEQLQANAAAKRGSAAKAAAWSSAVLLGGGGFMMARRAAKKRRR
jgi:ribosomal protein L9